jgi:hypothetical protein
MLFIYFLLASCICIFILLIQKEENYNYFEENPNALKHGKLIAGTVYADDPEKTPGLGLVL